jgi:uncharacterized protein YlxP (DUF503 family)
MAARPRVQGGTVGTPAHVGQEVVDERQRFSARRLGPGRDGGFTRHRRDRMTQPTTPPNQEKPVVIGTLQVTVQVPESRSLKDKRMVVRSITSRVRQTFAVAVAEVGEQDSWQTAVVGVACVSNNARHADEMCQKVLAYIENDADGVVSGSRFELVHL